MQHRRCCSSFDLTSRWLPCLTSHWWWWFILSQIDIKSYEQCVTAESQGFPLPVLSYLERYMHAYIHTYIHAYIHRLRDRATAVFGQRTMDEDSIESDQHNSMLHKWVGHSSYVYVYIYICIHIYIHTNEDSIESNKRNSMLHKWVGHSSYVCMYIYMYTYIHTYIHMKIRLKATNVIQCYTSELDTVHMYMYIYVYIYTYIHTYIHTYIWRFVWKRPT
jgi:hypothetical protein